jgi:hypothetical protein
VQETIHVPKKKGEIPTVPKGIYTSPGKKGTFGFNKFTLSERQGYKVRPSIPHLGGHCPSPHTHTHTRCVD